MLDISMGKSIHGVCSVHCVHATQQQLKCILVWNGWKIVTELLRWTSFVIIFEGVFECTMDDRFCLIYVIVGTNFSNVRSSLVTKSNEIAETWWIRDTHKVLVYWNLQNHQLEWFMCIASHFDLIAVFHRIVPLCMHPCASTMNYYASVCACACVHTMFTLLFINNSRSNHF